jgi:hypothetical protein
MGNWSGPGRNSRTRIRVRPGPDVISDDENSRLGLSRRPARSWSLGADPRSAADLFCWAAPPMCGEWRTKVPAKTTSANAGIAATPLPACDVALCRLGAPGGFLGQLGDHGWDISNESGCFASHGSFKVWLARELYRV